MPFLGINMFRSLHPKVWVDCRSGKFSSCRHCKAPEQSPTPTRDSCQKQVRDVAAIVFRSPPLRAEWVWRGILLMT